MAMNKYAGMLAGNPMSQISDPFGGAAKGAMFGQITAQGLGGMAGRDMRTGEQIAAAEEAKFMSVLGDKSKTPDDIYKASQEAFNKGYTQAGQELLKAADARKNRDITIRNELQPDGSVKEVARFNDATGGIAWTGGVVETAEERKKKGYAAGSVDRAKRVNDLSTESAAAYGAMNRADDLIAAYEKNPPAAGRLGSVWAAVRGALGAQTEEDLNRTNYLALRNSEIVNSLPKGAASDRDIAVFSEGYPDSTWSSDKIQEWLKGYKKAKAIEYAFKTYKAKRVEEGEPIANIVAEFYGIGDEEGIINEELQKLGIVLEPVEKQTVDLTSSQRKGRAQQNAVTQQQAQPQAQPQAPAASPVNVKGMLTDASNMISYFPY